MFYSKLTGGFYHPAIHGDAVPSDAVEISDARHAELLEGQSSGLIIQGDEDGVPFLEQPPPQAPQVPRTVTRFQALAALHLAGHLPAVQAIMAAPETPVIAKLAWENALSFERSSPTLSSLAAALGLSDADLDALFVTAASIEA